MEYKKIEFYHSLETRYLSQRIYNTAFNLRNRAFTNLNQYYYRQFQFFIVPSHNISLQINILRILGYIKTIFKTYNKSALYTIYAHIN